MTRSSTDNRRPQHYLQGSYRPPLLFLPADRSTITRASIADDEAVTPRGGKYLKNKKNTRM